MAVPYLWIERDGSSGTVFRYNTYDTWGLIPDGRLTVSPPDLQEKYLEIPGRNGELDISDILTGSVQKKNRTGSWEFYLVPYGYAQASEPSIAMQNRTPAEMAQIIYSAIHGAKVRVWLNDDLTKYYTGRVKIKSWPAGKTYSKISIEYNLDPERSNGAPNSQGGGVVSG